MSVLAELFCSNVRAELFRLLFGFEAGELHLREIQRRSGLAVATVRQDVKKLEKIGLVNRRRDGNRVYFCANIQHPLYTDIRQLVLKTVGLADVLRSSLQVAEISGSSGDVIRDFSEYPRGDLKINFPRETPRCGE